MQDNRILRRRAFALISKETFCKALALIQEQDARNHVFSKAIELMGNGHFVFGTEDRYREALLLVLAEAVNDLYGYIEWWLYETNFRVVRLADESKYWDLATPEALYDYIVNECQ